MTVTVRSFGTFVAVAAECVLSACAGTGGVSPESKGATDLGGSVVVRIEQYREDEVAGMMQVGISNNGPQPLLIEAVDLAWPGFAQVATAAPDYRLPAGAAVDLPMPVAPVECAAPYTSDPRPSAAPAEVTLRLDGGSTVRAVVADTSALKRIYETECQRQYLASQVDIAFGLDWTLAGDAAETRALGTLVLRRVEAPGVVAVTGVDGSVLLALTVTGAGPVVLAADRSEVVHPVEVRSTLRCDGHALGESKQTFAFDVMVDLGDGQPLPYPVTPDEAGRVRLQQVIDAACG